MRNNAARHIRETENGYRELSQIVNHHTTDAETREFACDWLHGQRSSKYWIGNPWPEGQTPLVLAVHACRAICGGKYETAIVLLESLLRNLDVCSLRSILCDRLDEVLLVLASLVPFVQRTDG